MTIKEALKKAVEILKDAGIDAPAADAGAMLCALLKCGRAYLYAHGTDPMNSEAVDSYFRLIGERAQRRPLQYITGRREFMSLEFAVNSDVLIPRQETETLVETVIGYFSNNRRHERLNMLDMGTGSGCIAISLASYIKDCSILACDISQKALDMAVINAERCGVKNKIAFLKSDLFSEVAVCCPQQKFDAIVSNPPYIRTPELETLEPEVRVYEPALALDGGPDGLEFYRKIISKAPSFLKDGGLLALETGYDQSDEVAALMKACFNNIGIIKDISGAGRVVTGIFKIDKPD